MVNYGNGKIYKLVNNVDDKIYVGSTCNTLSRRKGDHKARSKKYPNRTIYKHIEKIGGWDNVEIILIENYECKNKDELHKRERHFIDELKPELNKQLPTRTLIEWREDNKEKRLAYNKERYENKKDEILRKQKEWRKKNKDDLNRKQKEKFNCECGGKYMRTNKAQHMESKRHIKFVNQQ